MYRGRTMTLSLPPFTKAVKWLVIVNAGVLLLKALLDWLTPVFADYASYELALVPELVVRGHLWQLFTYSFLHAGISHLFFNMLWLWWFGAQLEMDWGAKKFMEFYSFCVVGAALVTVAVSYTGVAGVRTSSQTVGASGGIFGILMAFAMLYGEQEIWLFPIPFSVKAKYFVAGVGFFTLIGAIMAAGPRRGDSVAYVAHLGGLLFGFLYVKFLPRRGLGRSASEQYFSMRNAFYRWKRRRAAKKFEVYMRQHDQEVHFDEHGNYIPPEDDSRKGNGGSKSGWVN
ncbi:Rhomboid-like protein [Candidatus Sulfotelmatobacter kueseliae]|uniref:Rhomboid-like protein n=1 Tax=Candidatus Sulfotelmatobacter kueseliae TaxID=2042962 RepID=A0A2U3LA94_9BACT|nr:Rhomboid-like protein [Candidatus Sulfotelmatobacter kueseliae]